MNTHTPSPTVIDAALKLAADIAELAVAADFGGNDIAGLRNGIVGDAAIQAFLDRIIAAIELGERRAEAAVVGQTAQIAALTERVVELELVLEITSACTQCVVCKDRARTVLKGSDQ